MKFHALTTLWITNEHRRFQIANSLYNLRSNTKNVQLQCSEMLRYLCLWQHVTGRVVGGGGGQQRAGGQGYYPHYPQTGGAIVYIAHSSAGPRPTLASNTTGHTHSWKLATVLSLRQQDYSFLNFLSSETMDYDVDIYPKSLFIEVLLSPIAGKHQVTQTLRMVEL